jgi:hypothetical protein
LNERFPYFRYISQLSRGQNKGFEVLYWNLCSSHTTLTLSPSPLSHASNLPTSSRLPLMLRNSAQFLGSGPWLRCNVTFTNRTLGIHTGKLGADRLKREAYKFASDNVVSRCISVMAHRCDDVRRFREKRYKTLLNLKTLRPKGSNAASW